MFATMHHRLLARTTGRERAEADLRDSERRARAVVETALDAFVSADSNGLITDWNAQAQALFGWSRKEVLGRSLAETLVPSRWRDVYDKNLASCAATVDKGPVERRLEVEALTKAGGEVPVELAASAVHVGDETVLNLFLRDLSGWRRAKRARSHLAALVRSSDVAIIGKTLDGIVTIWNQGAERLYGYAADEMIGRPISVLAPPDLPDEVREILEKVRQGHSVEHFETVRVRKDGQRSEVSITVSPIRDDAGTITGASDVARDVSERKRAEAAVRESETSFRLLFESNPQAMWVYDLGTLQFLEVNASAIARYGYTRDEFLEMRITDIRPPDELTRMYERLQSDRPNLQRSDGWRHRMKDGRLIDVEISSHTLEFAGHKAALVLASDVTAKKRADEDLREAQEQLHSLNADLEGRVSRRTAQFERANRELALANRQKSEFLANMSHELRTPLNAIIGFSEVLLDPALRKMPEEQALKFLGNIEHSGRHLLGLINDILDLSKVEAGHMELHLEDVKLGSLILGCVDIVRVGADRKQIRIETLCSPEDAVITADPARLKQILYNLLSNAVKFTPEGGSVKVKTAVDAGQARVEVRDNGIGIRPEDQELVFEEFRQVSSGLARQEQGTGLGLALVRKLVALHGGTVGLTSVPGQGSCFTFTLPAAGREGQALSAPEVPALIDVPRLAAGQRSSGPTIVVVEDDHAAAELLSIHLSQAGYLVQPVSARQAVGVIQQVQPFAVTLDIQMPDRDGWEILADLKASASTRGIPVILITMIDEPDLGRERGATDHLVKPIDKRSLLSTLDRLRSQDTDVLYPTEHSGASHAA